MKNKKSVKSYVNSILIGLVCCTSILSIILVIIGNPVWGIAIYPILGIIAIPNIIMHAIKNNKLDENDFTLRKNFFDKYYIKVDNTEKYYKMILFDLIKKSIISSVGTIVIVFGLLYLSASWYINDGPDHLNDRFILSKMFHPSRKVEGGMFFITIFLLTFGLPIIAYVIITNIYKVLTFKKKKYYCYRAVVENIDLSHNLHVKSVKKTNGFNLDRKHDRNEFKNYKCIGISKAEIINEEVIIVLIPGTAYLIKADS